MSLRVKHIMRMDAKRNVSFINERMPSIQTTKNVLMKT